MRRAILLPYSDAHFLRYLFGTWHSLFYSRAVFFVDYCYIRPVVPPLCHCLLTMKSVANGGRAAMKAILLTARGGGGRTRGVRGVAWRRGSGEMA